MKINNIVFVFFMCSANVYGSEQHQQRQTESEPFATAAANTTIPGGATDSTMSNRAKSYHFRAMPMALDTFDRRMQEDRARIQALEQKLAESQKELEQEKNGWKRWHADNWNFAKGFGVGTTTTTIILTGATLLACWKYPNLVRINWSALAGQSSAPLITPPQQK